MLFRNFAVTSFAILRGRCFSSLKRIGGGTNDVIYIAMINKYLLFFVYFYSLSMQLEFFFFKSRASLKYFSDKI